MQIFTILAIFFYFCFPLFKSIDCIYNVLDLLRSHARTDGPTNSSPVSLKQLSHLILRDPHSFSVKPDIKLRYSVLCLIDYYFTFNYYNYLEYASFLHNFVKNSIFVVYLPGRHTAGLFLCN